MQIEKHRVTEPGYRLSIWLVVFFLGLCRIPSLHADTMTIGGTVTQSTQDGTGPAANNPGLNDIKDGEAYSVSLSFNGSIAAPGTYDLTGSTLSFSVVSAGAVENQFDSVSLTVTQFGVFDQLSLFACLATGSGCNQGNELDLSFMIRASDLNSGNVTALGVVNLLPLDLLQDDGVTDIQGSIASYSYTPPGTTIPTPEPASILLAASVFAALSLRLRK